MRLPQFVVVTALALLALPALADQEIRIGVGLSKPPYILESGREAQPASGAAKIGGLEVEIVEQALAAGGYRMIAESYPPARALALVRAGHLDGMATVTEGIGAFGHFSDDYITYRNVAITLRRRAIRLDSVADLARHSVAAFQNARFILTPEFAAVVAAHENYTEHPQQITQNRLLYSGRADVVIGDRLIFHALSRQVSDGLDTAQPVMIHELFPPMPRKMVFRDPAVRDAFNAGLKAIRADGTYAATEARYHAYLKP
jgi:polar amino acid transport system substrate-binding protein